MYQRLVSHNEDLRKLVEKGYAVGFDNNCLIVRDIPYLDEADNLKWGALVAKLEFIDREHVQQTDHQVFFAGTPPHNVDGTPVRNLGGGPTTLSLSEASADVVVQRSFSNKPKRTGKYRDFYHKVETYVSLISGPAMERHGVHPYTFKAAPDTPPDPIFVFQDTLTSRADIGDLRDLFADDVVAVIGLGGTGSYVLDYLVKTPVPEIRGYDRDPYHVHNAFRSPGRTDESELGKSKAEVYAERYQSFRRGLVIEQKFIDASSSAELDGVTFAFVCVDNGPSRAGIFEALIDRGIPFIDVGMGLNRKNQALTGMVRATYYSKEDQERVRDMGLADLTDDPDDLYRENIQIGELNALNAAVAMIRFKQIRGFYVQEAPYYHLLFRVADMGITSASDLNGD